MIKIVNKLPVTAFNDALYTKITSIYMSYGTNLRFCSFWAQTNSDNNVTAIICKFYSAVTVCALNDASVEEINKFLNIIGYSEIQSNIKLNDNYNEFDSVFLECSGNGNYDFSICYDKAHFCYEILNQYPDEIKLGSFDEWYVDISHRIRHNSAFIINEENSSILCLIGQKGLLLSGIAVNSKSKGIGSNIIKQLCCLADNVLFAICSKDNLGFYLKLGFKPHEKIYYYKG